MVVLAASQKESRCGSIVRCSMSLWSQSQWHNERDDSTLSAPGVVAVVEQPLTFVVSPKLPCPASTRKMYGGGRAAPAADLGLEPQP